MDRDFLEVRAALSGRPSFNDFVHLYFGAKWNSDGRQYVNDRGEILNYSIASEFYDDFMASNMDIEAYKRETITHYG